MIVGNRVSGSGSSGRSQIHQRARPLVEILEGRQLLATITVTTTGDADGADGSSTLSLRQAIEISNGTLAIGSLSTSQAGLVIGGLTTPNTIDFDIPGTGPFTIEPTSSLPIITSPAVIDGYSEPGAHANTNGPRQGMNTVISIELDGAKASGANGLQIQAGQSTVEGLAIGGFTFVSTSPSTLSGIGIVLQEETGDLIEGNFLGTDTTGTAALPNAMGIEDTARYAFDSSGPTTAIAGLNTIGGAVPGAGNLISGNAGTGLDLQASGAAYQARDQIQGNFIGLDVSGSRALPNGGHGIDDAGGGSTIGGTASGTGNVISGNGVSGLLIDAYSFSPGYGVLGSNDLVQGNLIGTDATGTFSVPNVGSGIEDGGAFSTIGGTGSGQGNVLSGNGGDGIDIVGIDNLAGPESDDRVQGNFIGTDITGSRSLPNGGDGIKVAGDYNTIGGTAVGAGNTISGNGYDGLDIPGSFELVEGNDIGTDSAGARALPNESGIVLDSSTGDTIGGTAAGAGNVISGNTSAGIDLANGITVLYVPESNSISSHDLIEGNFIGTDAAGTQSLPNGTGIELDVSDSNTIGGTAAGAGNIISGNLSDGIGFSSTTVIEGAGTIEAGFFYLSSIDNIIEGNLIGTDPTGTIALGNNNNGIEIDGGSNNTIGGTSAGAGNVIAFNGDSGINIIALYSVSGTSADGPNAIDDTISGNSIFANGKLGIDLDNDGVTPNNPAGSSSGANLLQPYPLLTSATLTNAGTLISATLDASPSTSYTVEFFASPVADPSGFGQGKTYLGSAVVTTDATGHASFSFTSGLDLLGQAISATATDPSGNTSEFARDVTVGYVTTTSLIGPGSIATLGVPTTFAAVVGTTSGGVPTGLVEFVQDGIGLGSAPLNASGVAVFITQSLSPGTHAITAVYLGDSTHAASQSNAVAISVFAPHAFGGPAVTSVVALVPDLVTIDFNRGLIAGPADDAANYKIVGPGHHSITVESAIYDPVTDSVTLTTLQKLVPGQSYQLTINGETGDRIVDVFGIPLHGQKKAKPGHNYVGKFVVKKVAHPSGPKAKAKVHASASKKSH
jgi:hypothetical protein